MTREEITVKLNEVFKDVFDDEYISITDSTTAADIEDWDSLNHIFLITSTEKAFNIKFSMGETQKLNNVGEMIDLILKRAN